MSIFSLHIKMNDTEEYVAVFWRGELVYQGPNKQTPPTRRNPVSIPDFLWVTGRVAGNWHSKTFTREQIGDVWDKAGKRVLKSKIEKRVAYMWMSECSDNY